MLILDVVTSQSQDLLKHLATLTFLLVLTVATFSGTDLSRLDALTFLLFAGRSGVSDRVSLKLFFFFILGETFFSAFGDCFFGLITVMPMKMRSNVIFAI